MEKNQMKNIVVLKNLPSNLVEEAFVILKSNKVAESLKYIDKKDVTSDRNVSSKPKDYIIREAEMIISSYISSVEKNEKKQEKVKLDSKYKRLRVYSIIITALFVLEVILL